MSRAADSHFPSHFEKREAMFWKREADNAVRCGLCPHRCHIPENKTGICAVRENCGGTLFASSYGQVSSIALDPVEKKPLYLFHPGKFVLSVGSFGCNFHCPFCQNSEISIEYGYRQRTANYMSPRDVANIAQQTAQDGNIGAAYTYNEPLIGYEFVYDCARLIHGEGLYNILVTNGYICKEPLEALLPWIDAMNIDLKGFSDHFYSKVKGRLDTVLETIAISAKSCHVEVTTLVIPDENEDDIEEIAKWISSVDREIPLHLSRFFPRYHYSGRTPTPRETILKLCDVAKKYLSNVFAGNI